MIERSSDTILRGVSLTVVPGDRIGLVGPNGVGKSTLLAVLAGELAPVSGLVSTVPDSATVGLFHQELDARHGETIGRYIARRVGVAAASDVLDSATDALEAGTKAAIDGHQRALDHWMRLGGADLESRLETALASTGLTLGSHELRDHPAAALSGGEQARVGLAVLQLARYDVLLLDEPTNNLDAAGLEQLEALVLQSSAPMVIVSHDRSFLERVITSVVELDAHARSATAYAETWAGYRAAREVARRHAEERYQTYRTEADRLTARARTQRAWAEKGVRGERTPPDNDRAARGARIERTEKQAAKARQTERALDRLETIDKPWEPWQLRFTIGETERSGDVVAELRDAEIHLRSSDGSDFNLGPLTVSVSAGDRLAVRGANGAGKTTFVEALLGRQPLDAGSHRLGRSVVVGRLDQDRLTVGSQTDPLDEFAAETGLTPSEARSVLAKFGIEADHLARPTITWSPGERTRATLAAFQATGVNTLVLDEPTNHLDLPAIEQLESAVDRFVGTLIVVTHDRSFADAIRFTRAITLAAGQLLADDPV